MTGFVTFWSSYPRKVGRIAAEKAYAKALKRASEQEILSGLEQGKRQWSDPKFIPHPATWLNQGRWMDEHEEPREMRQPWKCLHVDRCSNAWQCKDMDILNRPRRAS